MNDRRVVSMAMIAVEVKSPSRKHRHLSRVTLSNVFSVILCVACASLNTVKGESQEFKRAAPGFVWNFPADHGSHPSYATEWWYYTGQLYAPDRVPFKDTPEYGFQLTFFRKGIAGGGAIHSEFMAHAAITDVRRGRTFFASRIGGGSLGIAGVSDGSLRAWSGDWSADPIGDRLLLRFGVFDRGAQKSRLQRVFVDNVPKPWLQGAQGLSAKGSCPGCASMYYSLPALSLSAQYIEGDSEQSLRGIGWMDHEFMTNSLSSHQVGWDWCGLLLKDGRQVMLFQVRDKAGNTDFASGGVRVNGIERVLRRDEFTITPLRTWVSETSRAAYPIEWRIVIPSQSIDTIIQARVNASEIGEGPSQPGESDSQRMVYWEGPVASQDEGVLGYLEMTGYTGRIAGM